MKKELPQLFAEFIKEEEFSAKLSSETLRGYRSSFDLLLKIMPTIALETISPKTMTEFFTRLEKRERTVGQGIKKRGVRKSTVATYRSKLNKFFEWLKNNRLLGENPFKKMQYPSVSYEDKKFLKKEDIEAILTTIDMKINWRNSLIQKRNMAMICILFCCGLRKSELLGLKVYDIDLERKILTVRAEISKSRIDRSIPLNSLAVRKLEDYINERKKRGYSTSYFFVSNNHDDRFTKDGFKHLIDFLKRESGINFHAHQLRHTFAITLISNNSDISKLKQLMGHKDIRMTASYLRYIPTSAMRGDVESITVDNLP
ncbi:site-specific recombinase XerD [Candidatus Methanoperedens nitroreducens]|uniref:Site-specific recombinase XerD n=1 Tax=Candidatus Methanoperedens nitratireducens TaxID=1392998 RepID=A0A062V7C8_9EURY|nr:tyrosine-type recombinase/integrase [Candidatus Methanoperedens nitroreducens]KCZ71300.1 site-specific recombinase XerD [Candidatus Methanoperedens nitroreducens]MDJ1423763.1 tyrosine-type recombinase/integrase [Candidatus Methanoperedens sp.]